ESPELAALVLFFNLDLAEVVAPALVSEHHGGVDVNLPRRLSGFLAKRDAEVVLTAEGVQHVRLDVLVVHDLDAPLLNGGHQRLVSLRGAHQGATHVPPDSVLRLGLDLQTLAVATVPLVNV